MEWKEFSVLTEGACVEAIAGIFHQLGSGGVVIEDPQMKCESVPSGRYDSQSVAPDFPEREFVVVKAYFPAGRDIEKELQARLQVVEANFDLKCQVFIDQVNSKDWEEAWKKYYHVFKIGSRLVVKPAWEDYSPAADEIVIDIDPGMSFGTGVHASTRFCLRFMEQYIKGGETIVDAGCGSGILSIAAVKMGARHAWALDIDKVAVETARSNVCLNQLQNSIEIEAGDVIERLQDKKPDFIFANITAEVVCALIPVAVQVLPPGGYLFCSGIVEGHWPEVKKQLDEWGFQIEQVLTDMDWIGIAARNAKAI